MLVGAWQNMAWVSPPTFGGHMEITDDLVSQLAQADINLLIVGEAGVGKEDAARTIHRMSKRAAMPFLTLDCGAPTETITARLFGHPEAPSAAPQAAPGLLEMASGGSVFLAEVGELEIAVQTELLRVVETREFVPHGGSQTRRVDVRYFAATSRDLESDMREGKFRMDLFFRLNGITLEILPERLGSGWSRPAPPMKGSSVDPDDPLLLAALAATAGSKTRAAQMLDLFPRPRKLKPTRPKR